MDPLAFAGTMRAWAHSLMADGPAYRAGLSDGQLATVSVPSLVFSGAGGQHPQHTAEALHKRLPTCELVITTEYYPATMDQILRESEEKGDEYFDAALVDRIDEFVRLVL